jgi:hypothetical protein
LNLGVAGGNEDPRQAEEGGRGFYFLRGDWQRVLETMPMLALSFLMSLWQTQSAIAPISIPKIEMADLAFSGSAVASPAEPNVDWTKVGLPICVFQAEGPFLPRPFRLERRSKGRREPLE